MPPTSRLTTADHSRAAGNPESRAMPVLVVSVLVVSACLNARPQQNFKIPVNLLTLHCVSIHSRLEIASDARSDAASLRRSCKFSLSCLFYSHNSKANARVTDVISFRFPARTKAIMHTRATQMELV